MLYVFRQPTSHDSIRFPKNRLCALCTTAGKAVRAVRALPLLCPRLYSGSEWERGGDTSDTPLQEMGERRRGEMLTWRFFVGGAGGGVGGLRTSSFGSSDLFASPVSPPPPTDHFGFCIHWPPPDHLEFGFHWLLPPPDHLEVWLSFQRCCHGAERHQRGCHTSPCFHFWPSGSSS